MEWSIAHLITMDAELRSVPADREALTRAVARLRSALRDGAMDGDPAAGLTCARQLGCGLLALGRFNEAQAVLGRAVEFADLARNGRAAIAARINLGDAYRYAGDLVTAEPLYRTALHAARTGEPGLVDTALQHLGKHLLDAGRPQEARACLHEALARRHERGDPELIESTTAALRLAARRFPADPPPAAT